MRFTSEINTMFVNCQLSLKSNPLEWLKSPLVYISVFDIKCIQSNVHLQITIYFFDNLPILLSPKNHFEFKIKTNNYFLLLTYILKTIYLPFSFFLSLYFKKTFDLNHLNKRSVAFIQTFSK